MGSFRLARRVGCVALAVALLATASGAWTGHDAASATVLTAWRARVGASGVNGMATIQPAVAGTGSLVLQLLRLPASVSVFVTVRKGTCASAGSLLAAPPAFRSSSTGGGVRTIALTKAQVTAMKAAMTATGKVAIRIRVGSTTRCGAFARLAQPTGFLTRQGAELVLVGRSFHELGFNKYDLTQQFVVSPEGAWGDNGPNSVAAGELALQVLQKHGFRVVRTSVSPYYPAWFEQAFFDRDPARQAQKRREYFAGFDAMLDACDRHGIRIVASLIWNVGNVAGLGPNSMHEGIAVRTSPGRARVEDFVRAVVTRYRDRPTIAMWEIGNEFNLLADLQNPDPMRNYTSDELATFYGDIATIIRTIDTEHLITTGSSAPRPAAMHLLTAARAGAPIDWTPDTPQQLTDYLRLINPAPIDVISIHYAEDGMTSFGGVMGSPANLRFFAEASLALDKPLFVGEIGYSPDVRRYDSPAGLGMLRATLPVLVELKLPLTLYWMFNDDRGDPGREKELDLRYGRTDAALSLIEDASVQIRR